MNRKKSRRSKETHMTICISMNMLSPIKGAEIRFNDVCNNSEFFVEDIILTQNRLIIKAILLYHLTIKFYTQANSRCLYSIDFVRLRNVNKISVLFLKLHWHFGLYELLNMHSWITDIAEVLWDGSLASRLYKTITHTKHVLSIMMDKFPWGVYIKVAILFSAECSPVRSVGTHRIFKNI